MKNSEKYKTAEEREQAYTEFCRKYTELGFCRSCPLKPTDTKPRCCTFYWLDLEAEEENPMPCPFCGRNTIAVINGGKAHKGQFAVQCYNREDECCYTGPFKIVRDEAISAHNRVSKAVAAYKEGEVK